MNIPKENPFRQLDKQLVLCLQCIIVIHIMYNRVLYMILILPRHCIIYDHDSSPSVPYLHEERSYKYLFNLTLF